MREIGRLVAGEKKDVLMVSEHTDLSEFEIDEKTRQKIIFTAKLIGESIGDLDSIFAYRIMEDEDTFLEPDRKIEACLSISGTLAGQGFNMQARRLLLEALRLMSYGENEVYQVNTLFGLSNRINTQIEKARILNLVLHIYKKDARQYPNMKDELLSIIIPFAVSLGKEYDMAQIVEIFGEPEVHQVLMKFYETKEKRKKKETKTVKISNAHIKRPEEKKDISNLSAQAVSLAATGKIKQANNLFEEILKAIVSLDKNDVLTKTANFTILLEGVVKAGRWMDVTCIKEIINEAVKVEMKIKNMTVNKENTVGISLIHRDYIKYRINRGESIDEIIKETQEIEGVHVRANLYSEILTDYVRDSVREKAGGEIKKVLPLLTGDEETPSSVSSISFPSGKGTGFDFNSTWSLVNSMLNRGERIPVFLEMLKLFKGEDLLKTDVIKTIMYLDRELKELKESKKFSKKVTTGIKNIVDKGRKVSGKHGLVTKEKGEKVVEAEKKEKASPLSLEDKIRRTENFIKSLGVLLSEEEIEKLKVSESSRNLLKNGNFLLGPKAYIFEKKTHSDLVKLTTGGSKDENYDDILKSGYSWKDKLENIVGKYPRIHLADVGITSKREIVEDILNLLNRDDIKEKGWTPEFLEEIVKIIESEEIGQIKFKRIIFCDKSVMIELKGEGLEQVPAAFVIGNDRYDILINLDSSSWYPFLSFKKFGEDIIKSFISHEYAHLIILYPYKETLDIKGLLAKFQEDFITRKEHLFVKELRINLPEKEYFKKDIIIDRAMEILAHKIASVERGIAKSNKRIP